LLSAVLLERWPQDCRVKITFTKLPTNRFVSTTQISMKCVVNLIPLRIRVRSRNTQPHLDPLHRIEFGPPKFFSKTFRFSMIFYSTLQFSGGGHFRKACRSRKKEKKQSEITCKQSEPVRTISKIEKRREFVRAVCYQQCSKNSFKRLYIVKELLFLSKKLHFQKNFGQNFNAVERVRWGWVFLIFARLVVD